MLEKTRKYFQELCDENRGVDDLTPYFQTKAAILKSVLFHYTDEYDAISEKKNFDSSSETIQTHTAGTVGDIFEDEDLLIEVLKEILVEEYEPPSDNLVGIQLHLTALWIFYGFVTPEEIDFDTLLKLDIATLMLIRIATPAAVMMKPLNAKSRHSRSVKVGNANQKGETRQKVLEAYNDLGASWLDNDSKNPIFVDNKHYSLNRFITAFIIGKRQVPRDTTTIKKHLGELKKDGII